MTRADIIRMAWGAGARPSEHPEKWDVWEFQDPAIERFAALVAEAEREACAKVCADYTAWGREWGQDNNHMAAEAATNECAAAIRARREKT